MITWNCGGQTGDQTRQVSQVSRQRTKSSRIGDPTGRNIEPCLGYYCLAIARVLVTKLRTNTFEGYALRKIKLTFPPLLGVPYRDWVNIVWLWKVMFIHNSQSKFLEILTVVRWAHCGVIIKLLKVILVYMRSLVICIVKVRQKKHAIRSSPRTTAVSKFAWRYSVLIPQFRHLI